MTNRSAAAVELVAAGVSQAEAARRCGLSRQAVASAIKARQPKTPMAKPERQCSECGGPIAPSARGDAVTCSGKCRAARLRRQAKIAADVESKKEKLAEVGQRRRLAPVVAEIGRIKSKAAAKV